MKTVAWSSSSSRRCPSASSLPQRYDTVRGASDCSTRIGTEPYSGKVIVPVAPTPVPSSTARPNQREMCSGSVTAVQTFSMGAAMRIVRRTLKVPSSMTDASLSVMLTMIGPFVRVCNF